MNLPFVLSQVLSLSAASRQLTPPIAGHCTLLVTNIPVHLVSVPTISEEQIISLRTQGLILKSD